ncbi:uncharacterized protein EKO05_0006919 [Ascochyta rabiei]|uniref:uncharacterized protein n=1 Tax=Didymella rabiei TaxID=5454 RepID=UPI00220909D5|nr:uncharacterized protein EKO05_0006919 [Ascochyta rabiei]UPX16522.1 hypothetical protein EKO05_0006919 [Ascochyta rabiei]
MNKEPSWISKVIEAIEKVCHHLHHGLEKAYFIAWLATKDTKLLVLHRFRSLLLKLKSALPCEICLVPVVCGYICDRCVYQWIGRSQSRLRGGCIDRITAEMMHVWNCVAAVPMARPTPCSLSVVAFAHFVKCFVF